MRDRVRCPFCPRSMLRDEYQEHFDRLHAVDLVSGRRNAYREPMKADAPRRETRPREPEPDEQTSLPME